MSVDVYDYSQYSHLVTQKPESSAKWKERG